jgi:hypothetical protein
MKLRFLVLLAVFTACTNPARGDGDSPLDQPDHAAYGGIGIQITSTEDGQTLIAKVIDGGAAAAARITAGDAITAVNGQPISGVAQADIARQIAGAVGTNVTISVRHTDGTQQDYTLIRRVIAAIPVTPGDSAPTPGTGQFANPPNQIPSTGVIPPTRRPDPGAPKSNAAAERAVILSRQTIRDEQNDVDALTVLVPAGWKVQCKFNWNVARFDPVHPILRVLNPNGAEAYANYGAKWYFTDYSRSTPLVPGVPPLRPPNGSNDGGSIVRTMFSDPADFVTKFAINQVMEKELQTARLVDAQDMPQLGALALAEYNGIPGAAASVTRLRYEYDLQGKPVQEDVYVTIGSAPLPGGTRNWYGRVTSFRAEKGMLDDNMGLLYTIECAARPTLEYYALVQEVTEKLKVTLQIQHDTEMYALNAAAQRSAIRAHSAQVIAQNQKDAYDYQMKAQDETAARWSQVAWGVETRMNPITQTPIEVPDAFAHSWVDDAGNVLGSKNPGYDVKDDPSESDHAWTPTAPPPPQQ